MTQYYRLPFLISLCALTACKEGGTAASNHDTDVNGERDPALRLSRAQILEDYSGVSCESLRHIVDYLDQIGNTDYFRGLSGELRYQPLACRSGEGAWNQLDKFYTNNQAVKLPNKVFLTKLDVPTRNFSLGFPKLDGSLIKTSEGTDLVEYFSLKFRTELKLGAEDEEGDYEFAFLADDGVRMEVGEGLSAVTYIDSPGIHATKMVCGTGFVNLNRSTSVPATIKYFQGPRTEIALTFLWRKKGSDRDSLCGQAGQSLFFNYRNNPSTPQPAYNALLARGWSVVPAHVFRLPRDEYMNPCESDYIRDVITNNEGSGSGTCTATSCDDIGL